MRVERHVCAARLEDRDRTHHKFGALVAGETDGLLLSRLESLADPRGQSIGEDVVFGVGQRALSRLDRNRVGSGQGGRP